MDLRNYITSLVRTWVPVGVGVALSWLAAKYGIVVDDATKAQGMMFFTAFVTGIYYAAVRWLESKFPKLGWLLGLPVQPGYLPVQGGKPQPPPTPNRLT